MHQSVLLWRNPWTQNTESDCPRLTARMPAGWGSLGMFRAAAAVLHTERGWVRPAADMHDGTET